MAVSRSRPFLSASYLTSFGSRPVSLRIFSSTFFRLSLAFSSCSCKVLTATAIFSLQQASRLLYRPRLALSRRETREEWQQGAANDNRRCFSASTTQRPEEGEAAGLCDSGPMKSLLGGCLPPPISCGGRAPLLAQSLGAFESLRVLGDAGSRACSCAAERGVFQPF